MPKTKPKQTEASYNLILPRDAWRDVRMLAAAREINIRELMEGLVRAEIESARRKGELPK